MQRIILHEIGCYLAAKNLGFYVSGIEINTSSSIIKNCMQVVDFNTVISNKSTLNTFCKKKLQFLLAGSITSLVWEGLSKETITEMLDKYDNYSTLPFKFDFYKISEICLILANLNDSTPQEMYSLQLKKTIKMLYKYKVKINNLYNNLTFREKDKFTYLSENEIKSIFSNEFV